MITTALQNHLITNIKKTTLRILAFLFLFLFQLLTVKPLRAQSTKLYQDQSKPLNLRVNDLLSRLSLEEKVSLLGYSSKAVPRLGIPAYNWWNEGLHGLARAGEATVFPQAIAMAATFNPVILKEVSTVISTEARSKYNLAIKQDRHLQYMGLSFWTPNINIFRDPRWGRGQETYGEDPYLTSVMGSAFVHGLQGDDPRYLKTSATAKHFVAHSGPENVRDYFDAKVDEKDLRETYFVAFQALVRSGVESVMTAYNSVDGVPNSINKRFVTDILRKEWGFRGHVVTDCGALDDVFDTHKAVASRTVAAADAIKAGINLDCSTLLQTDVIKAVHEKLLMEKEVDTALSAVLRTEFKLGFYDDPEKIPYHLYGADSVHTAGHIALSRKVAQESMVLLKNENHLLPLNASLYSSMVVLGPTAASLDALLGSYHGVSSKTVNFVEGITAAVDPATRVEYDLGADYRDTTHFGGIWAASNADLTIAVIGLTPVLEGEAGDAFLAEAGGDKKDLSLPPGDVAFMKALRKGVKKPIIAVITAGSDVDVAEVSKYADAVILAWYPGEQGGNALADILFGKVSPSGHLPLTFYNSINDLPAFTDYHMKNRTYRYFKGQVQYPFGFGMSYSDFQFKVENLSKLKYKIADSLEVKLLVKNTGSMDADEVVQLYIKYPSADRMPLRELKAFRRLSLKQGEEQNLRLTIAIKDLEKWDLAAKCWKLYPGKYQIQIGENSLDEKKLIAFKIN